MCNQNQAINLKPKIMKNVIIILMCCLFTVTTIAQNIITIDNSPQSTTTHQTLQDGLDAASAGDFIYIQPTPIHDPRPF